MRLSNKHKAILLAIAGTVPFLKVPLKSNIVDIKSSTYRDAGIKSVTLLSILITMTLMFKGWFQKLTRSKKILCIISLGLLGIALLCGLFPAVHVLIKLVLFILTLFVKIVYFCIKIILQSLEWISEKA